MVYFNSEEGHHVQIGIVSGGTCQSKTEPSIFSRVEDRQTLDFIRQQFWQHVPPSSVEAIEKLRSENKVLNVKYDNLEDKVLGMISKMVILQNDLSK